MPPRSALVAPHPPTTLLLTYRTSPPLLQVIYRTSLHNTVFDVMSSKPGWEETDSDTDWDLNWADVGWIRDYFDHMQFDDQQRVNHFRNHYELTRKDLLVKNLKRMKRHLERSDSPEEVNRRGKIGDEMPLSRIP